MILVSDAQLQAWLAGFLLPFFRVLALFSAAPILSMRAIPVRVRIGLALVVAASLAPAIAPPALPVMGSLKFLAMVAHEVSIGLAVGFAARLVFAAFDLAGEIIGLQMGLSYGGFFDPMGVRSNAVGAWMSTTASLMFVSMNGLLVLVAAVLATFVSIPIGLPSQDWASRVDVLQTGRAVFVSGLLIALPFMTIILFVNVLMGVVSRIAPQLSLFSVGFPITLGIGLLLLVTGLPWIEAPMVEAIDQLLRSFALPPA